MTRFPLRALCVTFAVVAFVVAQIPLQPGLHPVALLIGVALGSSLGMVTDPVMLGSLAMVSYVAIKRPASALLVAAALATLNRVLVWGWHAELGFSYESRLAGGIKIGSLLYLQGSLVAVFVRRVLMQEGMPRQTRGRPPE